MGLCGGGAQVADDDGGARAELEAAKKANRRIATRLMDDEFASKSKRKMLLLGAGESGKSTLFKQMQYAPSTSPALNLLMMFDFVDKYFVLLRTVQVIHGGGYTDDERMSFRWIIHRNVIDAMKILLEAAADMDLKIAEENEDRADRVEMWEAENLNEAFAADIDALWRDPAIQACFGRKNEFQLGDGAVYFLNDVRDATHSICSHGCAFIAELILSLYPAFCCLLMLMMLSGVTGEWSQVKGMTGVSTSQPVCTTHGSTKSTCVAAVGCMNAQFSRKYQLKFMCIPLFVSRVKDYKKLRWTTHVTRTTFTMAMCECVPALMQASLYAKM
eukprot:2118577-Pleurochrysis_carterae.AAC.2